MADQFTISAVLKLDDQASAALDRVKSGFSGVAKSAGDTLGGIKNFAMQTASVALGMNIGSLFGGVVHTFHDIIEAAKEEDTVVKRLAGTLMMTGKSGESFDSLKRRASAFKEEMQDLAITTGTAEEQLVEAFEHLTERSAKPPEEIAKLVKQMALAGRIVPGGVEAMTQGFQMMEMGVIRAKNPLVLLIKQSGLLEGTARDVAKSLMAMGDPKHLAKLSPEVRKIAKEAEALGVSPAIMLAEKAMGSMAERAKGIPMKMSEMLTSLKEMKGAVFEMVGLPVFRAIVEAIKKPMEDMRKFFFSHKEDIEKIAKDLGTKVGEWMTDAAGKLQEGFEYLQTHSKDIMHALETGANVLMAALRFMVQHKTLLLTLAAAKVATDMPGAGAVGSLGKAAIQSGVGLAGSAGMGAAAGTAAGLGALAAALVGVGLAAHQATLYLEENAGHLSPAAGEADKSARANIAMFKHYSEGANLARHWDAEEEKRIQLQKKRLLKYMQDAGYTEGEQKKHIDKINSMWNQHAANRERLSHMEIKAKDLAQAEATPTRSEEGMAAIKEQQVAVAQQIQEQYKYAAGTQNQASLEYIAQFVASNISVQNALLTAGPQVGLAFEELAALIGDKASDFSEQLKAAGKAIEEGKTTKPKPAGVSIGGPSTFNIKQDFRDQDPDRVAIVFQKDLMRAALTPRQSRVGSLG